MSSDKITLPSERSVEYPFTDWQLRLETAVGKFRGRPRYCGINAYRCLRRAWIIADRDPEMALFRAITAEEEAATALIFSLKQRKYPGSEKLNHHLHPHKAGISPFLKVVEGFFAETKFPTPRVILKGDGEKPRIDIEIPVHAGLVAVPDEPLNGLARHDSSTNPKVLSFGEQAQRYADLRGAADMLTVIRNEANFRNQIIYATDDGIPVARSVDPVLIARGKPVTLLLGLTIIILQTSMHQIFAVQILQSYLQALKALPSEIYDYSAAIARQMRSK